MIAPNLHCEYQHTCDEERYFDDKKCTNEGAEDESPFSTDEMHSVLEVQEDTLDKENNVIPEESEYRQYYNVIFPSSYRSESKGKCCYSQKECA